MKQPIGIRARGRFAFSLIELLVVVVTISLLIALLLPAFQQCREAARRCHCSSQLAQIGIALHHFESAKGRLPSAWLPTSNGTAGWSVHAQILPFLEKENLYSHLDFSQSWTGVSIPYFTDKVTSIPIASISIPDFHCPSAKVATPSETHYAVNRGTWLVFDPTKQGVGDGPFVPGSTGLQLDEVRDGLMQTLAFAEVLPGLSFLQNGLKTKPLAGLRPGVSVETLGGVRITNAGHQEWMNGQAIETGFTATGAYGDLDWINVREGTHATAQSYAVLGTKSNHPGGSQVCMLDGAVRLISSSIAPLTFRAMVTRDGDELDSISSQ